MDKQIESLQMVQAKVGQEQVDQIVQDQVAQEEIADEFESDHSKRMKRMTQVTLALSKL